MLMSYTWWYSKLSNPDFSLIVILNYYFLMWLSHENPYFTPFRPLSGWVQVGFPLKGVECLTVNHPGNRAILGQKKTTQEACPDWEELETSFAIISLHCGGWVWVLGECRKVQEHFFCGEVILSLLLPGPSWNSSLGGLSGISEWHWGLGRGGWGLAV